MSANATLDLMEEIPQLHEDNQACHGQPDVTKKLTRDGKGRRLGNYQEKQDMLHFHNIPCLCAFSVSYQHMDMVHEV